MRKHSLPPELGALTPRQLAEVDSWLDRFTYAKVGALYFEKYGKPIGRGKLTRYYANRAKARILTNPGQPALGAADLVAIRNGDPIPDAKLNKRLLQKRCFHLAQIPGLSPLTIKELLDIFTYEERRSLAEKKVENQKRLAEVTARRAELSARRALLRAQELAFRAERAAIRKPCSTANSPSGSRLDLA